MATIRQDSPRQMFCKKRAMVRTSRYRKWKFQVDSALAKQKVLPQNLSPRDKTTVGSVQPALNT
jgi:hypothetical protein